ncbi:DUF2156 domain-containing protein [Streptomyces sp. NPDC048696]|uniref:DUF2156 domain-containing protein n=1 Tax=Streptomyces sp. NPDC048696 TaxID=3365585 RepID=UPI00371EDECB
MSVRTLAVDRGDTTMTALRECGENPSAFLGFSEGNEYFTVTGARGVVPYRAVGGYLHQIGGVTAPDEDQEMLLRAFVEYAGELRRKVIATRLRRPEAELFARCGFTVNQAGSSYSVYLPEFRLGGDRLAELRLAVSQARLAGLEVAEVAYEDIAAAADEIGAMTESRPELRVFAGRIGDEVVAYIAYAPVFGTRPGLLHHLARRAPGAPQGVLEAVNLAAVLAFAEEDRQWLHLGFTPLAGLGAQYEVGPAHPATARALRLLAERGERLYPTAAHHAYQRIWDPHLVQPGYLACHGRVSAGAVRQLLRLTRSP